MSVAFRYLLGKREQSSWADFSDLCAGTQSRSLPWVCGSNCDKVKIIRPCFTVFRTVLKALAQAGPLTAGRASPQRLFMPLAILTKTQRLIFFLFWKEVILRYQNTGRTRERGKPNFPGLDQTLLSVCSPPPKGGHFPILKRYARAWTPTTVPNAGNKRQTGKDLIGKRQEPGRNRGPCHDLSG